MIGMPAHPYEQQELYAPQTTLFDQLTAAAAAVAATDSPVPSEPLVSMCATPQILLHPAPRHQASFSFPPVPVPSFGEWLDSFPPQPRESVTNAVRNEYLRTYRSTHPPPQPPPPPPPSPPIPPQHMSRFIADYTLEIALPEWPVLNLVMYPNGCVHLLSDGRGVGMFTTDRVPAATRTRVGILQQPEVTQVLDDSGEITYSQRGGVAVELVQVVDIADLERMRENVREAGKSCMKLVAEDQTADVTPTRRNTRGAKLAVGRSRPVASGAVAKGKRSPAKKRTTPVRLAKKPPVVLEAEATRPLPPVEENKTEEKEH